MVEEKRIRERRRGVMEGDGEEDRVGRRAAQNERKRDKSRE